ncbi:hypothetical protein ABTZ99_11660 [Actinosynnema sp. NPDC002837]
MKASRTSLKPVMVAVDVLDVDDVVAEELLGRFLEASYLEITDRATRTATTGASPPCGNALGGGELRVA